MRARGSGCEEVQVPGHVEHLPGRADVVEGRRCVVRHLAEQLAARREEASGVLQREDGMRGMLEHVVHHDAVERARGDLGKKVFGGAGEDLEPRS